MAQLNGVLSTSDSRQDQKQEDLKPAEVIEAAKWANLEENGMWHARVAKALCDNNRITEAIQMFETSLELDGTLWLASQGLAICKAKQEEYQKAITTAEKGIEKFHADSENASKFGAWLADMHASMGDWYCRIDNTQAALHNYKKAFELNSREIMYVYQAFNLIEQHRDHKAMMDFLEDLHARTSPETGTSSLVQFNSTRFLLADYYFCGVAARTAHKAGRLEFVRENLQKACTAARKDGKIDIVCDLQNMLGLITWKYFQDEAKALHIWEQVVETSSGSKPTSNLFWTGIMTSNQLAPPYYNRALAAAKDSKDRAAYINRLEDLSKAFPQDENDEASQWIFTTREATRVLGRLYHIIGEEGQARECFRQHVKLGVDLLTDEDPTNDWEGFEQLANVFKMADDDVHAAAAYSALGPVKEDNEDGKKVNRGAEVEVVGDLNRVLETAAPVGDRGEDAEIREDTLQVSNI